jgi:hypothetical protein
MNESSPAVSNALNETQINKIKGNKIPRDVPDKGSFYIKCTKNRYG